MTDDITKNMSDSEKLDFLINAVSDTNRRLTALEERHIALEQLVHERLYDTRPLWHEVLQRLEAQQQQLATLQQQLTVQQQQLTAQQQQLDRLELGQRRLDKKIERMHLDHLEIRADLSFLEKRVEALENPAQPA